MYLFYIYALLYGLYRAQHPWCVGCRAEYLYIPATTRAPHRKWAMRYPFCARCAVKYMD